MAHRRFNDLSGVEPGEYTARVKSKQNPIKYSLAIGETEAFDGKETLNAVLLIPQLKRNFFDESHGSFIISPLGGGFVLIIFILSFLFGYFFRAIQTKYSKDANGCKKKNIGAADRLVQLFISMGLLVFTIFTTWNPFLLFISGFILFEALSHWCVFYSFFGKNTFPVENSVS